MCSRKRVADPSARAVVQGSAVLSTRTRRGSDRAQSWSRLSFVIRYGSRLWNMLSLSCEVDSPLLDVLPSDDDHAKEQGVMCGIAQALLILLGRAGYLFARQLLP